MQVKTSLNIYPSAIFEGGSGGGRDNVIFCLAFVAETMPPVTLKINFSV